MQELIRKLIELQAIDTRIAEINAVINDMPQQVQLIKTKLDNSVKGHDSIKIALESNKNAYLKLEAELSEMKELLKSSQKKLTSVQNNKEYQSVLREQDILKKHISDSETKLKDMTADNFRYESEFATVVELKANLEVELKTMQSSKKHEDKELHAELEGLLSKREVSIKDIKKSDLAKYDRIRGYRKNLAITTVSKTVEKNDEKEVCNGCLMRIPPQLYVDVKKDNAIYTCPHCQRILYFPNEEK